MIRPPLQQPSRVLMVSLVSLIVRVTEVITA